MSAHAIEIDDERWPSVEHFYQGAKFRDADDRQAIREAGAGRDAARIGRGLKSLRADWDDVRESFMRTALEAKFTQHPDLRELLLSTNDAVLVEHTGNDAYWADGGDGTGLNRLGVLLMELRDRLRA